MTPRGCQPGIGAWAPEEDHAVPLHASMDAEQRAVDVAGDDAPAEILTRLDPVAEPAALSDGRTRGDLRDW